jgi:hypothetical protein
MDRRSQRLSVLLTAQDTDKPKAACPWHTIREPLKF